MTELDLVLKWELWVENFDFDLRVSDLSLRFGPIVGDSAMVGSSLTFQAWFIFLSLYFAMVFFTFGANWILFEWIWVEI